MGNVTLEDVDTFVASRIREAIEAAGKSELATATESGIPQATFYRRLQAGSFTVRELARIARVLDVELPTFLPSVGAP